MRVSRGILGFDGHVWRQRLSESGLCAPAAGRWRWWAAPPAPWPVRRRARPRTQAKAAYNSGVRSIKKAEECESDAARRPIPRRAPKRWIRRIQYYLQGAWNSSLMRSRSSPTCIRRGFHRVCQPSSRELSTRRYPRTPKPSNFNQRIRSDRVPRGSLSGSE